MRFSAAAIRLGARRALPLLAGLTPFGLVVGLLAQGQGLSLAEIGLMSGLCYAGSAQLLALSHWSVPAPVVAASLAAFVVNLRLVLMGPVLAPWLDKVRGWRLLGGLFLMADQNWALSVEAMRRGEADAGFLVGSGGVMWLAWVGTTLLGHVLGRVVAPPPGHPIFFAALAVFVALLVPMWRGRADALPWLAAAAASVSAAWLLPGSWYIVVGALAGSAAGLARDSARGAPGGAAVIGGATLLAILGMAAATFACRYGGYWLFSRMRPRPWLRTALSYVPGALFVSYVAPALVAGGTVQWVGAAATAAAMLAFRDLSLAVLGGTAVAWGWWAWG